MRVIEFLASQLDREIAENEKQATQHIFTEHIDFWNLCLECKRLLLDEKTLKEENKNAPDKSR